MPYIIRPHRISRIAASVFGTAVLFGATPVAASANSAAGATSTPLCPSTGSSSLLAQYGDNASYSLLANGSFESGSGGWSLTNASILSTGVTAGASSVELGQNGTAVSPKFCVSGEYPSFRFFVRSSGQHPGPLNVSLRYTGILGLTFSASVGSIQATSGWTLSPALKLAEALPLNLTGGATKVSIVFQSGLGGSWTIGGVYIDPYSR
jgi:hypothetical protein